MYRIVYVLLLLVLNGCDQFPKDPNNTLEKISGKKLKVGIAESGEWASYKDGVATGIEVEIIKGFAESIKAQIEWVPGSQDHIINLMSEHEVDICIGNFTKKSPFKKHAGFSIPFYTEKIKVGAPAGVTIPEEIEDVEVLVKKNSEAALVVKKEEAKPVLYDSVKNVDRLIVAPEMELQKHNLQVSEYDLKKIDHVIAIPKGENALLEKLDKYLDKHGKIKA